MSYLFRKIEQAHVVWFQASNQWVQFDEQQWLIFCFYNEGLSCDEAIKRFSDKSTLPPKQPKALVENLYTSLHKLFNPDFELPNFAVTNPLVKEHTLPKKKTRHYVYLNKPFVITYGSPFLEQYIHLPLAHLETESVDRKALSLEVFKFEDSCILRENGLGGECLSAEEPGQIKRLLYIALANYFYQKDSKDWLTFIHGSALKKGDEVLVLTSMGGSGKSTMAGLLHLNGLEYFSDDFLPVDTQNRKAYPFPAALCIKNDAIQILESQGLSFSHITSKQTAYANTLRSKAEAGTGEIKNVVFITYNKGTDIIFKPISQLEALKQFFQEAWVGDDMQRAEIFIDWFTKLIFYKLEYGNTPKAIEALKNLMDRSD